jgi:hypothetical protein
MARPLPENISGVGQHKTRLAENSRFQQALVKRGNAKEGILVTARSYRISTRLFQATRPR